MTLQLLPVELLLKIWDRLESKDKRYSFIRTCKQFKDMFGAFLSLRCKELPRVCRAMGGQKWLAKVDEILSWCKS
jgi:hypothetical protein